MDAGGFWERNGGWGGNQGHLQLSILTGQERTSGGWKDGGGGNMRAKGWRQWCLLLERSGSSGCEGGLAGGCVSQRMGGEALQTAPRTDRGRRAASSCRLFKHIPGNFVFWER